jgi:hypothetical protein
MIDIMIAQLEKGSADRCEVDISLHYLFKSQNACERKEDTNMR